MRLYFNFIFNHDFVFYVYKDDFCLENVFDVTLKLRIADVAMTLSIVNVTLNKFLPLIWSSLLKQFRFVYYFVKKMSWNFINEYWNVGNSKKSNYNVFISQFIRILDDNS